MIQATITMIKNLLRDRLTLTDLGELEGDYRAFHLKDDIALSLLSYAIASISILIMLFADTLLYKSTSYLFDFMVFGRIVYVLVTILITRTARRTLRAIVSSP